MPDTIETSATDKLKQCNVCQHNDNQSREYGSTKRSGNDMCNKYTAINSSCPMWCISDGRIKWQQRNYTRIARLWLELEARYADSAYSRKQVQVLPQNLPGTAKRQAKTSRHRKTGFIHIIPHGSRKNQVHCETVIGFHILIGGDIIIYEIITKKKAIKTTTQLYNGFLL
jgi:hypothetical protein